MSGPWSYSIFGGTLRSELPIDELPRSLDPVANWSLRLSGPAADPAGDPLGSDVVFGETMVRGFRTPEGFSLVFDDTGRFDVSADGERITWHRPPEVTLEAAVADISSRVLALALHASGVFTLHASAVSFASGGIAFVAPKHHGKSTLCSALVLAGARVLSDDTVPVQPGPTPHLRPGLPRLRLWSDAASRLFGVGSGSPGRMRKHQLDELDASQVEDRTVPLRAAYVLSPTTELREGKPVVREPLDAVNATMVLVAHAKLGPVLGGSESTTVLSMAADLARSVPVYTLSVLRNLDRLDEVAGTIVDWHRGETAASPAVPGTA